MAVELNRNNTNFSLQVHEYLKGLDFATPEQRTYSFLKYYQNLVREYINNVNIDARGLLIYHTMGLGKSLEIVAIAMDQVDRGRQVIVLLTKSLQENLRMNIRKYIQLRTKVDPNYKLGQLPENDLDRFISKTFAFVSMNASNMIKQMVKAAEGDVGKEFAVVDAKIGHVVSSGTLDGKLVLVDEAQNLFRAITNGSKNAKEFYDMVVNSRNSRVVFFSGTPISSNPFELVSCFNMIGSRTPGKLLFPESYTDFYKMFVDKKAKIITNKGKLQNRILGLVSHVTHTSKIARNADGKTIEFPKELPMIVERVPMDSEQFVIYQLARDKEAEEGKYGQKGEAAAAPMAKPKKEFSSSYKQKSRQLSNYCPPPAQRDKRFSSIDVYEIPEGMVTSPKLRKIHENITKRRGQIGFVYSQFVGAGGLGILQRYLEIHGWRVHDLQKGMKRVLANREENVVHDRVDDPAGPQPVANPDLVSVFEPRDDNTTPVDETVVTAEMNDQETSTVLGETGDEVRGRGEQPGSLQDIASKLQPYVDYATSHQGGGSSRGRSSMHAAAEIWRKFINLNELEVEDTCHEVVARGGADTSGAKTGGVFAIISGSVDTELRQKIQDIFNSEDNKHGGKIDLLLISSTGAEGLDLKNVRHLHVMEPYWNYSRVAQIKARGVRNDSHAALPPDQRDVQPYIYLAVKPDDMKASAEKKLLKKGVHEDLLTTDEELWYESAQNQLLLDSFLQALKEVSIECQLNDPTEYKCRVCNPTNTQLFYDDIDLDLKTEDKCMAASVKTVKANEVVVNGVKYYYVADPTNIYGWKIYEYDPLIKGIREMPQDIALYGQIVDVIDTKK